MTGNRSQPDADRSSEHRTPVRRACARGARTAVIAVLVPAGTTADSIPCPGGMCHDALLHRTPPAIWRSAYQGGAPLPVRQLVQQGTRLLEVDRVETFCEPGVDGCQPLAGVTLLALLLPEPAQADGRP